MMHPKEGSILSVKSKQPEHQGLISMGNSDPCMNGPNCWFLWNSDCWYKHPYEEKKKVLEMKREVRRAFEEKRRAEENAIAEEAFKRIPDLPEELKIHILHHLSVTLIEKLELPTSTLRAVLQVHISLSPASFADGNWIISSQKIAKCLTAKYQNLIQLERVVNK